MVMQICTTNSYLICFTESHKSVCSKVIKNSNDRRLGLSSLAQNLCNRPEPVTFADLNYNTLLLTKSRAL
jgi:hypothetical protein